MNILIMGLPAAGKSSISSKIISNFLLNHISTGNLLRQEQSKGTKIGKIADKIINIGGYMPDDIMIKMVKDHIDSLSNSNILLDGFPRTLSQVESIQKFFNDRKSSIKSVIYLDVDKDIAINRIFERSKKEGRLDDTKEAILIRWEEYSLKTIPVLNFYENLGIVKRISANGSIDEVWNCVNQFLKSISND